MKEIIAIFLLSILVFLGVAKADMRPLQIAMVNYDAPGPVSDDDCLDPTVVKAARMELLTRQLRLSDILRAWKKKLTHANYQLRFLRRSAGRRTCYENAE